MNFLKFSLLILLILIASPFIWAQNNFINTSESFANKQKQEAVAEELRLSFLAHKPSFVLPLSYNFDPNPEGNGSLDNVDNAEVKFQFSFKLNLIDNFLDHFKLSFGYTNLSFWQLYNKQDSAAFRETNHEPELFFLYNPRAWSSQNTKSIYRWGFVHQSNGRDVGLSRSWNRIYVQNIRDLEFVVADVKIWHRLKERAKVNPEDARGDDNPDITDFLGNFELRFSSQFYKNTWSILIRNNLKSDNKGAVELSLSVPFKNSLKFYVQYFKGYGDSLIDYNFSIERFSLGFVIADWL